MTRLDLARRSHAMFVRAMEHDPPRRREFVREACADDAELLDRVMALLDAADRSGAFLETPIVQDRRDGGRSPPDAVGNYLVVGVLGAGGMATVYEAIQEDPKRRVALKVLHTSMEQTDAYLRFRFETEALAKLRHPGIAQIYEAGAAKIGQPTPSPFFAMELIPDAAPITEFAERLGLSLRDRVALAMQVCEAIHHGHQHGVIHRDIKPGNVLVDGEGRPKVIDFGIARATDAGADSPTMAGDRRQLLGTLNYMSPEQCEASADIDIRTDVYSLGVLLYQLVAGRVPHDLAKVVLPEALRIIAEDDPPRATQDLASPSHDLDAIISMAMHKDRSKRYASAAALAADLRRWLNHEPIEARPPSVFEQAQLFARRHRGPVAAGLVIGLSVVTIALVSTIFAVRLNEEVRQRRGAQEQTARERDAARWQAYTAHIAGAMSAIKTGELEQMRTRLAAANHPKRGWEWGFLSRLAERSIRTERAHDDMVLDMDVSDDGTRIATAAGDGSVALWNIEDFSPIASIAAHDGTRVLSVRFTRDGRGVITGGEDGAVHVWDARDLGSVETIATMPSAVYSAVELVDGRTVVAMDNGRAMIFSRGSADGSPFGAEQPGGVQGAEVSDDGRWLATFNNRGSVWIRGADDLSVDHELDLGRAVMQVRFSPDGSMVGAAGEGGRVSIWTTHDGRQVHVFEAAGGVNAVRSIGFSRDGTMVAAGLIHRGIVIASIPEKRVIGEFLGHAEAVSGLWFSANDAVLISSSWDRTLRAWPAREAASPAGCSILTGLHDHARGLQFSPDGSMLAGAARDGHLLVWDHETGVEIARFKAGNGGLTSMAISPDGSAVAAAGGEPVVWMWDMRSGRALPSLTGHTQWIAAVNFDAEGRRIVAGGHDGSARVWDLDSGGKPLVLAAHDDRINSAAFSPDGRLIVTGSRDKSVRLWDSRTGEELRRMDEHESDVHVVIFSHDGERIYSGSRDQTIRVWNVETGTREFLLSGHGQHITSLSLDADSTRLAAGSWFGEVLVFDVETHDLIASFRAHDAAVRGVTFSPDGRWIATSSHDSTIRLFDSWDRTRAERSREEALAAMERAKERVREYIQRTQPDMGAEASAVTAIDAIIGAEIEADVARRVRMAVLSAWVAGSRQ